MLRCSARCCAGSRRAPGARRRARRWCPCPPLLTLFLALNRQVKQYEGPTECEEGDRVKPGDQLGMHYTGTIDASSKTGTPGKQFDSSRGRGVFDTRIGVGQVIPGWDQGLIGLCKGAKATLVIPPDLGYGEKGAGRDIPGGATLNFDVEVMSVALPPPEPNLFHELDVNTDCKLTAEEVLAHFKGHGQNELPAGLMENEDKNKDGFISWEEVCHRMRPRVHPPRVASSMIRPCLVLAVWRAQGQGMLAACQGRSVNDHPRPCFSPHPKALFRVSQINGHGVRVEAFGARAE